MTLITVAVGQSEQVRAVGIKSASELDVAQATTSAKAARMGSGWVHIRNLPAIRLLTILFHRDHRKLSQLSYIISHSTNAAGMKDTRCTSGRLNWSI